MPPSPLRSSSRDPTPAERCGHAGRFPHALPSCLDVAPICKKRGRTDRPTPTGRTPSFFKNN
eukprot:8937333-Lingulodinium_polyedra.AAC.1